ncbi:MAG: hypothetical protein ABID09_03255 [Candidatus Omnitrophota bacterium]
MKIKIYRIMLIMMIVVLAGNVAFGQDKLTQLNRNPATLSERSKPKNFLGVENVKDREFLSDLYEGQGLVSRDSTAKKEIIVGVVYEAPDVMVYSQKITHVLFNSQGKLAYLIIDNDGVIPEKALGKVVKLVADTIEPAAKGISLMIITKIHSVEVLRAPASRLMSKAYEKIKKDERDISELSRRYDIYKDLFGILENANIEHQTYRVELPKEARLQPVKAPEIQDLSDRVKMTFNLLKEEILVLRSAVEHNNLKAIEDKLSQDISAGELLGGLDKGTKDLEDATAGLLKGAGNRDDEAGKQENEKDEERNASLAELVDERIALYSSYIQNLKGRQGISAKIRSDLESLHSEYEALFSQLANIPGHGFGHIDLPAEIDVSERVLARITELESAITSLRNAIQAGDLDLAEQLLGNSISIQDLIDEMSALITEYNNLVAELTTGITDIETYIAGYNDLLQRVNDRIALYTGYKVDLNDKDLLYVQARSDLESLHSEYEALFSQLANIPGHGFGHIDLPAEIDVSERVLARITELESAITALRNAIQAGDLDLAEQLLGNSISIQDLIDEMSALITEYNNLVGQLEADIIAIRDYLGSENLAEHIAIQDALARNWNFDTWGWHYFITSCSDLEVTDISQEQGDIYKVTATTHLMQNDPNWPYFFEEQVEYYVNIVTGEVVQIVYDTDNSFPMTIDIFADREVRSRVYTYSGSNYTSTYEDVATTYLDDNGKTREVGTETSISTSTYSGITYDYMYTSNWERVYGSDGVFPSSYTRTSAWTQTQTQDGTQSGLSQGTDTATITYAANGYILTSHSTYSSTYDDYQYSGSYDEVYDPDTHNIVRSAGSYSSYRDGIFESESIYEYNYDPANNNWTTTSYYYEYNNYDPANGVIVTTGNGETEDHLSYSFTGEYNPTNYDQRIPDFIELYVTEIDGMTFHYRMEYTIDANGNVTTTVITPGDEEEHDGIITVEDVLGWDRGYDHDLIEEILEIATVEATSRDWNMNSYYWDHYNITSCASLDVDSIEQIDDDTYKLTANLNLTYNDPNWPYSYTEKVEFYVDISTGKVAEIVYDSGSAAPVTVTIYDDREEKRRGDNYLSIVYLEDGKKTTEAGQETYSYTHNGNTDEYIYNWDISFDEDGVYPTSYSHTYISQRNTDTLLSWGRTEILYAEGGYATGYRDEYIYLGSNVGNDFDYGGFYVTTYDNTTHNVTNSGGRYYTYSNSAGRLENEYIYSYTYDGSGDWNPVSFAEENRYYDQAQGKYITDGRGQTNDGITYNFDGRYEVGSEIPEYITLTANDDGGNTFEYQLTYTANPDGSVTTTVTYLSDSRQESYQDFIAVEDLLKWEFGSDIWDSAHDELWQKQYVQDTNIERAGTFYGHMADEWQSPTGLPVGN